MSDFDLESTISKLDLDAGIFRYKKSKSEDSIISVRNIFDMATANKNISDIHFKIDFSPFLRVGNDIKIWNQIYPVDSSIMETFLNCILSDKQRRQFDEKHEVNCSLSTNSARFRVNVGKEINGDYVTARIIPHEIIPANSLGFPNYIWKEIINLQQGLVLVTGITGSGKSTTLASLIQEININFNKKIICIEDPIEYVHKNNKSLIIQREVGIHTDSFYDGVRSSLRQDPDVILIGEIRDSQTAQAALQAAETGHLVFSTLHTKDSAGTITRYVDLFPEERKDEIRSSLSDILSYVLCQDLVPYSNKNVERILVMEIMKNNSAVSNMIREGQVKQIYSAIQTSSQEGMITMEQCLLNLYKQNRINKETAMQYARKKDYMKKELSR